MRTAIRYARALVADVLIAVADRVDAKYADVMNTEEDAT